MTKIGKKCMTMHDKIKMYDKKVGKIGKKQLFLAKSVLNTEYYIFIYTEG